MRTHEVRDGLEVLDEAGQLNGTHAVVAQGTDLLDNAVVALKTDPLRDTSDAIQSAGKTIPPRLKTKS